MDENEIMFSVVEYFKYLGGNENSRRVYEGEQVVRAGHIIMCGRLHTEKQDRIVIYALCLQTSALQSSPHVIKGQLNIVNNIASVHKMECSCKGGNSGYCKHISAVLLHCTRIPLETLEELSQTDLQCAWSLRKATSKDQYKAVSIPEMPCYKDKWAKQITTISSEKKPNILENLLLHAPKSALHLNRVGRRESPTTSVETVYPNNNQHLNILLNNASQSVIMMELEGLTVEIKDCCKDFVQSHFMNDTEHVATTTKISQREWHKQRKYRITGSRIYGIYTYAGFDWITKAEKYFNPKHFTNKFVKHGLKYEAAACECFVKATGQTVSTFGLIVSHNNNWLAYSPDGVIFNNGNPVALVEIKCPMEGATKSVFDVLKTLNYLKKNENNIYELKERHMYYGQIQCGMAMLNIKECYFLIYCPYDASMVILNVPYNDDFAKKLLFNVKTKYFKYMLHSICMSK
ncbi:uncharacterized protein [Diabrotica undecimpunctata]|uniref:uncharacterized protein isoform X1 n=1 Tax=Diabrotica undecimpunctata TaxID=50387 RepID=UPI003B63D0D3